MFCAVQAGAGRGEHGGGDLYPERFILRPGPEPDALRRRNFPESLVLAERGGRRQVDGEVIDCARRNAGRNRHGSRAAHLVAAVEDKRISGSPGAGAGVLQRPDLGEGRSRSDVSQVRIGLADERRQVGAVGGRRREGGGGNAGGRRTLSRRRLRGAGLSRGIWKSAVIVRLGVGNTNCVGVDAMEGRTPPAATP